MCSRYCTLGGCILQLIPLSPTERYTGTAYLPILTVLREAQSQTSASFLVLYLKYILPDLTWILEPPNQGVSWYG